MMLMSILLAVAVTDVVGDDCSDVKDKQNCGNYIHVVSMMIISSIPGVHVC